MTALVAQGRSLRSLVVQRMRLSFVFILIGKAFIWLSHAVVGDQRIDLHLRELLEVVGDGSNEGAA